MEQAAAGEQPISGEAGEQEALPGLLLPAVPPRPDMLEAPGATQVPFEVALLALGSVRGMGAKALRSIVRDFGERLGVLFELEPEVLRGALARSRVPTNAAQEVTNSAARLVEDAAAAADRLAIRGVRVVGPAHLPKRLANLPDGPLWLFVEGDPDALAAGPHVAVVGTRKASAEGVRATEAAVRTMAAYPMTLVSGLANGIDAAAHDAALRDGVRNVAFLGHGTDLVFPAETAHLRAMIVHSGGCVASEYLPGERYRKAQFVQRNRLQAALADLVVAAEGEYTGGTAHTVRFATSYKRPLIGFTWPGAGDLTRAVADQPTGQLLDIFDPAGRRAFDARCRALANAYGHSAFGLQLVERQLQREAQLRQLTPEDFKRLRARIDQLEQRGATWPSEQ
ncbi:DNA-processing protein DprA [Kitasatospora sp. NPDC001540]|uniref:DNA-processing protein DprA n=1 Tax=Kitasatospora sp. NPDC001540 TaxID=3364014 RepID=UPI00369F45A4